MPVSCRCRSSLLTLFSGRRAWKRGSNGPCAIRRQSISLTSWFPPAIPGPDRPFMGPPLPHFASLSRHYGTPQPPSGGKIGSCNTGLCFLCSVCEKRDNLSVILLIFLKRIKYSPMFTIVQGTIFHTNSPLRYRKISL